MSTTTRTPADIEADIVALKNANPDWLTNAGVQALITSLTNQINQLSSASSMQPAAGNYLHTTVNSLSYFHYKYIIIFDF